MLIEIENQPDVCILRLSGRFAAGMDTDYIRSKTDEIKALNCGRLMIDLTEVSSIGSILIGFVADLYTSTTRKAGGRFTLAGANTRVRDVFDLTRLSSVIPMAANPESGLAALRE